MNRSLSVSWQEVILARSYMFICFFSFKKPNLSLTTLKFLKMQRAAPTLFAYGFLINLNVFVFIANLLKRFLILKYEYIVPIAQVAFFFFFDIFAYTSCRVPITNLRKQDYLNLYAWVFITLSAYLMRN